MKVHQNEVSVSEHISEEMRRSLIALRHKNKNKNSLAKNEKLQCDQCDSSFSDSPNLRKHMKKFHWDFDAATGKYSGSLGPIATYKFAFKQKEFQKNSVNPKDSPRGTPSEASSLLRQKLGKTKKKSERYNDIPGSFQSKTTSSSEPLSDRFEEECVDDVEIVEKEALIDSKAPSDEEELNQHQLTKLAGRDLIFEKCGVELLVPDADVEGDGNCFTTATETSRDPTALSVDLDNRAITLRSTSSKFGLNKNERGDLLFPLLPGFTNQAQAKLTLNTFGESGTWSSAVFDYMPNYVSFSTGISFLIADLDLRKVIPIFPDTHFGIRDRHIACNLTKYFTAVVVRKSDHFEALENSDQVGEILQKLRAEEGLAPAATIDFCTIDEDMD